MQFPKRGEALKPDVVQRFQITEMKAFKGGGQLLSWHGLELRRITDMQFPKRGEALKPDVVQRFQFTEMEGIQGRRAAPVLIRTQV